MKKYFFVFILMFVILVTATYAQNYTPQFEESKLTNNDSLKVKVGADFAMQFQALTHEADSALIPLGAGINLPTANLRVDGYLTRGIKVNLEIYLSSRHHNETWVKGGYLLVDRLPFINSGGIDRAMDYLSLKIGVMELNYGDAHFRRSDNGRVTTNPFVGNYIMDAFTTAPALELMFRSNGWMAMGALTSGSLDPEIAGYSAATRQYSAFDLADELAFYGKLGFDKQVSDAIRLRLTFSGYFHNNTHRGSLYNGDRAGSRYYLVMNKRTNSANDVDPARNHLSGHWGPGSTTKNNSLMANLLFRLKGLELFGTFEKMDGTSLAGNADANYTQYAIEGLYYFGKKQQFYGGARYNYVENNANSSVNRTQFALGWFMTKNIVAKAEYVIQNYDNFVTYGYGDAGFNGLMVEAGISF